MWAVSGTRRRSPDSGATRDQAGVDSSADSGPRVDRSSPLGHDVPQRLDTRSGQDIEADAIADRVRQPVSSGQTGGSLGTLPESVRAITGVVIGNARLHDTPHPTRALRVQASTRGLDIFTGGHTSEHPLGHEEAHVAQQVGRGIRRVEGWSDPTILTIRGRHTGRPPWRQIPRRQ